MVKHEQASIYYRESKTLPHSKSAFYWWKNKKVPGSIYKGYVWIVHGIGEHMGRYNELANFLTSNGYDVVGIDLPGHGLSKKIGKQIKLSEVSILSNELKDAFIHWNVESEVSEKLNGKNWYLLGHSMGTILCLKWILQGNEGLLKDFPFAEKVFLSSPPLELRLKVPRWKDLLATKLARVTPHLALSNEIKISQLTHDIEKQNEAKKDPLFHSKASPGIYVSLNQWVDEILDKPQEIEVPLCIAVGSDDPVCNPNATEKYYQELNTHKKFLNFQGFYHEIFNEVERQKVYEELLKWIS
jgi:lysophospholipase